jgi:hypothetical protein
LDPVPAITGTWPLATSTQSSVTRMCSAWDRVGDSPVVPQGTTASVPWSICHCTNFWNADSSTRPFSNGVMRAVMDPLNIGPDMVSSFSDAYMGVGPGPAKFDHSPCFMARQGIGNFPKCPNIVNSW